MKKQGLTIILILQFFSINAAVNPYQGSSFDDVWTQITSDKYKELPQRKVSFKKIVKHGVNKILSAAQRTLSDRSDLLPTFEKLAHPNGICLAGTWKITESNPYDGYFKKGSVAPIIVRASTALSNTKAGDKRSFGMAGKLFPSIDKDVEVETANFFLVDDLGGINTDNYTSTEMTNEPKASITFQVLKTVRYAIKLARTFKKVDENPGMRQLYEISELGIEETQNAITPKWMMVKAQSNTRKLNVKDFRDELNLDDRSGELIFDIYVANQMISKKKKNWKLIGNISLTESALSNSCDTRLHFHHPRWKSLNHAKK